MGKYAALILFFVYTVCLYGPFSIYLPNAEELWFTPAMVWSVVLPVSLIVFLILLIMSLVLPESGHHLLTKLFFGLALALYIQGNFININYGSGVQDGSEIVWSDYTVYSILDILAWLICFAIPFLIDHIVKMNKKTFFTVITLASLFLTFIQVPAFAVQAATYQPNESAELKITTDNMFELSDKENILVFILDTMDEAYFKDFIKTHPDYTNELDGFVHFENTASAGSRTLVGVPAIFTGIPFTRQETYSDYLHTVWSGPNAFSALHDAGFEVDVYSEPVTFSTDAANYVDNFKIDGAKEISKTVFAEKIYKMDLFKYMPHFAKRFFWYDTAEFNDAKGADNSYLTDDAAFFADFAEKGFSADPAKGKVIQVYHLNGAHTPYHMNEYGEKGKSTREQQVAGCYYWIAKMLDDLRAKGLYDKTTIMITADHGDEDMGEYKTLLLKEAGAKGEYRVSSAPVSGFDFAPYLASLGGKTLRGQRYGMVLTEVGEKDRRERHFFLNSSGNSRLQIKEYTTTGHAGNENGWKKAKTYEDATGSAPVRLGTLLSFTDAATGNSYTVEGFGNNTGFRTRVYGPRAEMDIPIAGLPGSGMLKATLMFYDSKSYIGMAVAVRANGELVYNGEIDADMLEKGLIFEIPVDSFKKSDHLKLELLFPDVSDSEMKLSVTKRTQVASLVSLLIEAQE